MYKKETMHIMGKKLNIFYSISIVHIKNDNGENKHFHSGYRKKNKIKVNLF